MRLHTPTRRRKQTGSSALLRHTTEVSYYLLNLHAAFSTERPRAHRISKWNRATTGASGG